MPSYQFKQVDVFTQKPYLGNPVAVVFEAQDLSADDMQRIAAWANLSETTFLLPATTSEADYRLRIFTPKGELPFAGHPTVGSAHAVLEGAVVNPASSQLIQECKAGLLKLSIEGRPSERRIFVQTPKPQISPLQEAGHNNLASALGAEIALDHPPLLVDVGPVWLVAYLGPAQQVHGLQPDMAAVTRMSQALNFTGVTVFGRSESGQSDIYVRSFAPAFGVPEDPVCGSGNASVGAFIGHAGMFEKMGSTFVANQGLEMGRDGSVEVRIDRSDSTIEIGGASVTCIDGTLKL